MNILIDIGHPGQVHYFKNIINKLDKNNHKILIIARDREFIHTLLGKYNFKYINRGKGSNSVIGKFIYMFRANYKILKEAIKFKPDIFLSFSSPYAAQVSFLMRKPHITMNDSEHTDNIHSKFTYPFSSVILTPSNYQSNLGFKHIRFDNVVEGLYIHNKYFKPKESIKKELGIRDNEEYVLLRFVSWNAHHDLGQTGIDINAKRRLIKLLKTKYKIFISSENELPEEFREYRINISPEKMHHVLAFATMFIGESSTMGSESALMGTKAIVINSLPVACNIKREEDAGIAKYFLSAKNIFPYIVDLMEDDKLKKTTRKKAIKMQKYFIDATQFLVWFIEEYPNSFKIMKEDSKFQYNFKYKE